MMDDPDNFCCGCGVPIGEEHAPDCEEADEECGQCEGSGTTNAMGFEEECPVCDGSGRLNNEA